MSFICQNPTCAISIIKANIPNAGNCPVCQQLLVELKEAPLLSEEDEKLIASLPYVIAYPLKQTLSEKVPVKRIYLFNYTFLNYLKYLGLLSASEFFNSAIKNRSMVALFHQNLLETAFGKWNHYIREVLKFLKEKNHNFFCPELLSYYENVESGNKVKKFKGEIEYFDAHGDLQVKKQEATAIGILINFRNKNLGHGTPPDDEKSQKLWEEYFPIFRSLLEQMTFAKDYPMYKKEHGETYLLQSAQIEPIEISQSVESNIWIQNASGNSLNILPFFIVPGEVALTKEDKEQLFTYESYTGKTIKFFSPEGTEKQTSGKILERLNLLLRDKQKEIPFTPDNFTKELFLKRIEEENKILLDTLISEKKIIPGVYQHREQIEIKLREWIGARANIFFIAAEAGSGKTNLVAEIQKQYTERAYPTLLIRAGRMEKSSLKEQVAYLLNIDAQEGLDKYTAIAGTQAEPTFILIDGLNEAHNAEAIWQEIMEYSKIIEPGSIKFVVTSRANTKSDLERYKTEEADLNYLYGENKDHEKGLGAYAFWLTPLDMNEMKGAWENYVAKDKSRYKPLFSFDDIATFDRAIYNQINNPLVLRLFLEIYNGKNLPKKGGNHLHIWQDWFKTFSQEEQTFLKLLADEVWLKGENELLLDDLLNNEKLNSYLTSDLVNSPYARMKNMGWVSRYVKDMNGCLGFTVEGALLYLLGVKLQQQEPKIDLAYIQTTLSTGTKLQQSAIESFLCEQALAGDLDLITELIDAGAEQIDLCIMPLLYYLKAYGVEATINKVLEEPTENDWKALSKLEVEIEELQLHNLRKEILIILISKNPLNQKDMILVGLKAINILDKEDADFYFSKIDINSSFIQNDSVLLDALGNREYVCGNYDESLKFAEKCLALRLGKFPCSKKDIAISYNNIGHLFLLKANYNKAFEYFRNCLEIRLEIFSENQHIIALSYNNIARTFHKKRIYEKALEYYEKGLAIKLEALGTYHPSVATSYIDIGNFWSEKNILEKAVEYYNHSLNIISKTMSDDDPRLATLYSCFGVVYGKKKDYNKALDYYEKSLQIRLKKQGNEHPEVATLYNNIGFLYFTKHEFYKSIDYFKICLTIRLKKLGNEHPDVAKQYFNLGLCYFDLEDFLLAIENYKIGFNISKLGGFPFKIAQCYEKLNQNENAMQYFIQSAEIRKDDPNCGLEDDATIESVENSKRLAKELKKENELPEWMK